MNISPPSLTTLFCERVCSSEGLGCCNIKHFARGDQVSFYLEEAACRDGEPKILNPTLITLNGCSGWGDNF